MGGEHCAVFGCNNDRRYPKRYIVKENAVYGIRFHKCKNPRYYSVWTRLINREHFKVTSTTRVCSNHFQHGQPFENDPHPSLYLKGYSENSQPERRKLKRSIETALKTTPKRPRKFLKLNRFVDKGTQVDPLDLWQEQLKNQDHDYCSKTSKCTCNSVTCCKCAKMKVDDLEVQVTRLETEYATAEQHLKHAKNDLRKLRGKTQKHFSIDDIKHSNELIKMYTGIPSFEIFLWLADQIRSQAQNLKYFRGKHSLNKDTLHQINNTNKPGRKRKLSIDDELLLTLIKLRLNLREEDIAFRFRVAQCTVSQILSTWIPFLARELEAFIYWPTQEETFRYYPQCFHKYKGCVRCIIDCTEIQIDRPSLAATNNQVYSQYKSRPTLKCLVGITPGGTISYISKPVGGSTSDKKIVKMTGIVDKFEEGDLCMADRGFNIQELFLHKQVTLIIPPFTRTTNSTKQFTLADDTATKTVANARIHVERAIGRLKEFEITQGPIPLTMIDLMEACLIVCAAIVNLQPFLVPLTS